MSQGRVLVVGARGIAGHATVRHLMANDREVVALSRGRNPLPGGVREAHGDLLDPVALTEALRGVRLSAVVFTAWRQDTESENFAVNGAAVGISSMRSRHLGASVTSVS